MRGLVTKVLDGDTLEVSVGYELYVVRYAGADAPALSPVLEWQAAQALGLNELLVNGKQVTLVQDVTDVDAQGQYPRYVLVDNVFANYEMIRQGFARAVPASPDTACDAVFATAQSEAQAILSGVWAPTPMPTATITPLASITPTPKDTKAAVCDCKDERNYSCKGFATQAQAQACYNYCIQIGVGAILEDQNRNGLVCEGLP
jgi:micrococcal nuclease